MRVTWLSVIAIAGICLIYGFGMGRFGWPPAGLVLGPVNIDDAYYAAGRAEALTGMPGEGDIILLGDSLIDWGNWDELLPEWRALNRGIAGDSSADVLARLDEVVARAPGHVVLLVGINDVMRGVPAAATAETIGAIVSRLRAGGAEVTVLGVLKLGAGQARHNAAVAALNGLIEIETASNGGRFVDLNPVLAPDGALPAAHTWDDLHLTAAGYLALRDALKGIGGVGGP